MARNKQSSKANNDPSPKHAANAAKKQRILGEKHGIKYCAKCNTALMRKPGDSWAPSYCPKCHISKYGDQQVKVLVPTEERIQEVVASALQRNLKSNRKKKRDAASYLKKHSETLKGVKRQVLSEAQQILLRLSGDIDRSDEYAFRGLIDTELGTKAFVWEKVKAHRQTPRTPAGPPGEIRVLWHGTQTYLGPSILAAGLRPGTGGMFGSAIYAGGIEKAKNYIGYQVVEKRQLGLLLKLRMALGTCHTAESSMPAGCPDCDSVHGKAGFTTSWGGTLRFDEWAAYKASQVVIDAVYAVLHPSEVLT